MKKQPHDLLGSVIVPEYLFEQLNAVNLEYFTDPVDYLPEYIKRDFLIRIVGTRDLIYQGKTIKAVWLAYSCKLPHRKSIVKIFDGEEVLLNLSFGYAKVQPKWIYH